VTPHRIVRPGTWYAVLGAGAVVLLPPGEKRRVAAVWALVDDGAGFDEVLDALIAEGLRDLPGFALVSVHDGDARVVLRGGVTAAVRIDGEEVRVAGTAGATWVEREMRRVDGFQVEVDDEWVDDVAEEETVLLTLGDGIARASGVVEPATVDPAAAPAPVPDPDPDPAPDPAPEPEADLQPPPQDVATERMATPAPTGASPTTVVRLQLSTGDTVDVDRPVLLGRDPHPDAAGDVEPRLVALPSPSREISATHLEVRPGAGPDAGTVVATDLGSTNGTVVVQPGMPREELAAGVPTALLPGAVVDLGDGITIEVVQP